MKDQITSLIPANPGLFMLYKEDPEYDEFYYLSAVICFALLLTDDGTIIRAVTHADMQTGWTNEYISRGHMLTIGQDPRCMGEWMSNLPEVPIFVYGMKDKGSDYYKKVLGLNKET